MKGREKGFIKTETQKKMDRPRRKRGSARIRKKEGYKMRDKSILPRGES